LTEGAGFLNTLGAVRLARFFATAQPGDPVPTQSIWSKQIIWGNHRLSGGFIKPDANAFTAGQNWGAAKTDTDDNIVWGTAGSDGSILWSSPVGGNVLATDWYWLLRRLTDQQVFTILGTLGGI